MGISTLIIFIVIVLIATIAAIVLLNAANSLKNQAQITRQQSEAVLTKRLDISSVYGYVDKNVNSPTYNRIRYIEIIARMPTRGGIGKEEIVLDLRNTVLRFVTNNLAKSATFIDAGDADNETVGNPCDKTDQKVLDIIRNGVWLDLNKSDAYYKFMSGDYYTVGWILCNGATDDRMVFPGQMIAIFYAPPDGLGPDEDVWITIEPRDGGKTTVEFTTPDVFTGSVVVLYST